MRLMARKVCASSGHRESRLIREGVQGDEPLHLNAVVLSQTETIRLHLGHGLIADLLGRLGLARCFGLEVKQAELTVSLTRASKVPAKGTNPSSLQT